MADRDPIICDVGGWLYCASYSCPDGHLSPTDRCAANSDVHCYRHSIAAGSNAYGDGYTRAAHQYIHT